MIGIILALLASVLFTFADAGKKVLSHTLSPAGVILSVMTCGIIINGAYLIFIDAPSINLEATWIPVLFCACAAVIGELCFMHGIKTTDLSLAKPLTAVFPLFVTVLAFFLFGETPNLLGALGIATIVLGAYLLGSKPPLKRNLMLPLYRLRNDRGCQTMLLSALIGAIVMVAQKYGSQHSSGIMFFTLLLCIDWLVFAVIVWRRGLLQPGAVLSRSTLKIIIATGITWGVGGALAYSAFSYTMSAYVGAALQIQVLLSIILGAVAFKEKEIKQRFLAGCIMLGGIVMVAIGTP